MSEEDLQANLETTDLKSIEDLGQAYRRITGELNKVIVGQRHRS